MTFTPEQPMSRRALREAAARAQTGEAPAVDAVTGSTTPPMPPEALAVLEPETSAPVVPAAPPSGAEPPMSRRRLRELRETQALTVVTAPQPGAPTTGESTAAAPQQVSAPPAPAFPPVAPPAPAPVVIPPAPPAPAEAVPTATPPAWTAPQGHWTRQLDEEEGADTVTGREVGNAPQTASMLVIEDRPEIVDLGGPLNATGEVLLTGSINLSPDFAQTGAMGPVVGAELDDRFDRAMSTSPDDQPVRASAISSQHALGSPIVANAAVRSGNRGLTVLLVTASVLAVLVTGLVVVAILQKWI